MARETVIWAIPAGKTDALDEQIMVGGMGLLSAANIERVKSAAGADGWHSFRVVTLDLSVAPEFGRKSLNI